MSPSRRMLNHKSRSKLTFLKLTGSVQLRGSAISKKSVIDS